MSIVIYVLLALGIINAWVNASTDTAIDITVLSVIVAGSHLLAIRFVEERQ